MSFGQIKSISFTPHTKEKEIDGFRKELPFSELRLDTPFTFTHFDDFQIIDYSKDSIKGELIHSCKVNEQGNELFCYEKRIGDTGLYYRSSMCIYDSNGKLKADETYNQDGNYYLVGLPTYDSKGRKVKYELFEYSKHYDLKPGVLPDSVESISLNDTVNMNKLKVDSNYNIYSSWQQTDLWTWQYDEQGRVSENYHVDRLNPKYKSKTIYDKKGRIQKELGYRNFPPSKNNEKEITDSLTDITDYKYFEGRYVRKTKSYFYSTIDTFLVNSKNQILKKSFYAKNIDPEISNVDSIPFDHIENIYYEYDSFGRKIKRTRENGNHKPYEVYLYRNNTVKDLKDDDF